MAAQNNSAAPSLNILAQYVKDLSFENPNAPEILAKPPEKQPQINIQVNIGARQVGDADYEVDLQLEAKAGEGKELLFSTEITYSGIFRIQNVPADSLQAVIMVECPRLLFPFRAPDHRRRHAQWWLPAANDRPDRFRGALPAARRRFAGW